MKLGILIFILGSAFGAANAEQVKETKEKIVKDLEQGYDSLKAQIQELQEKARHTTGSVKKDMDSQIESLEKDQKELQAKINKMQNSSGKAWDDVKTGANDAYEKLKKSVKQAKDRFKEEKK